MDNDRSSNSSNCAADMPKWSSVADYGPRRTGSVTDRIARKNDRPPADACHGERADYLDLPQNDEFQHRRAAGPRVHRERGCVAKSMVSRQGSARRDRAKTIQVAVSPDAGTQPICAALDTSFRCAHAMAACYNA